MVQADESERGPYGTSSSMDSISPTEDTDAE